MGEQLQPLGARRRTRQIRVGPVAVGGSAGVSVQSMATTDTRNVEATVDQLRALRAAGCDIGRVAVPDADAAKCLGRIRNESALPLVADIHFDWRLALIAIEQGVDGIRLNPGNIGSQERVREVTRACQARGIPIRIGVNAGSLEKRLLQKYGGVTPEAMVESALDHVAILEAEGFYDTKISLKSSDVLTMIRAYRLLAARCDYPLHLGVTEAGTLVSGSVKSAVGMGVLLAEGIGDTIRVSLAADPVEEVRVGMQLLKSLGLREGGMNVVACPTCGRCSVDMIPVVERVEKRLATVKADLRVAIMGCEVNGPGEARDADVGIAYGHKGMGLLFKKGVVVQKLEFEKLEHALVGEALQMAGEEVPSDAAIADTVSAVAPVAQNTSDVFFDDDDRPSARFRAGARGS